MMERPGYLDEYLAFWSGLRQVERIWLSVYTPQHGEQSDKMLTADALRRLLEELPEPKHRYPALILPDGALQAFDTPPVEPTSARSLVSP